MQNKQTFSVSDLVAKYINSKNTCKEGVPMMFEYGEGEELLAHLYNDVAGENRNVEVWNIMVQYDQLFNDDALNNDEYDYLKAHFSETVEYMMQNHVYTEIMEVGTLPVSAVEFAIKYLGIKDGDKVYLPNAGYGDAVMLLRNKDITGFINGRFAWSLAQIRFYAAGINADIECLDISGNREGLYPNLPMAGSVDYIITVYNNARMMPEFCCHIDASSYMKCLSAQGKAFLFTDAWFLSGNSASNIIKSSVSVIQFPELLTESNGEVHGALCGVCVTGNTHQTSIDLIDLSSAAAPGKNLRVFDLDVAKALSMADVNTDFVKHLDKSKMDEDISLPVYYFASRPRIGHSIDKVMKLIDFKESSLDENLPVITSTNLSDDFSHSAIDVDDLDTISKIKSPWGHNNFCMVTEPCVLLSVSPTDVKCGSISEVPQTGLAVSSDIIAIKPENGVSFETAVLLLQSDYVKEQLSALTYSLHGNNADKYFAKVIVWPEVYNDELNDELLIEELQAQADMEKMSDEALNHEFLAQAANEELHDRMFLEEVKAQLAYEAKRNEAERRVLLSSISTGAGDSSNDHKDIEDSSCIESDVLPETDIIATHGECTYEELINALQVTEDERKKLLALAGKGIKEQKQSMQTNLVDSVEKLREENKKLRESYDKKLSDSKAAYINEVRMRKHDMRPHLRQIASTERLLSHYLEQDSDIDTMRLHLRNQISRIHDAVKHLSDLVEHLSDEDKFGTPERFNIDKYLNDLPDGDFFTIDYDCDEEMLVQAGFGCHRFHTFSKDYIRRIENGENFDSHSVLMAHLADNREDVIRLDTYIAPLDFDRLVQNIIENAKRHGFTDPTREDYNMYIYLTIDRERGMYQIDFSNNGNPLPEGMTKDRFGIRGEKAGLTGGTGQGGHIITSIVEHYGGDYDVFQDDASTVVRIYLPIMR